MKRVWIVLSLMLALAWPAYADIRRVEYPGGVYPDALPGGEFVVGTPQPRGFLQTHLGPIAPPAGEASFLMFNRITVAGGFKIASKSHSSDVTWLYENGAWRDSGRPSHGVQGHGFDDAGRFYTVRGLADQESQGLRYYSPDDYGPDSNWDVTNETPGWVTGSPSYNPFSAFAHRLRVTRLYEWTHRGGIIVGQGEEGGAVIQYRGQHYLLEPGDTRFIQFHRAGDTLSVAISKLRERSAVLIWLHTDDIERLPRYTFTTPEEPKVEEPKVEPAPQEPNLPADVCATLHEERAKLPTPLDGVQLGEMLNRVAWRHRAQGWGLSGKNFGTHVDSPAGKIAHDVLHRNTDNRIWDVLVAAGEASTPTCGPALGVQTDPQRPWVAPVDPGGTEEPKEDPKEPLPSGDIDALIDLLVEIEARLTVAEAKAEARHAQLLEAIANIPKAQVSDDKIDELIESINQERTVTFKLLGQNVTAVIKEGKKK